MNKVKKRVQTEKLLPNKYFTAILNPEGNWIFSEIGGFTRVTIIPKARGNCKEFLLFVE